MAWTDEQKAEVIAAYEAQNPTPENSMEIVAKGNTLIQKINGIVFATVTDKDREMSQTKGVLALQDHGKGCTVAFRNIRLKTLAEKNG